MLNSKTFLYTKKRIITAQLGWTIKCFFTQYEKWKYTICWVPFKSPTKYACAAFCRVKMACTWKHISYHPTSRAISQTGCKKGNLRMSRSILFWNQQISWRATVPGWYLLGFFTFQAGSNSFQGALPPMVGQSFLLASFSLPDIDGPASAAIWANCHVSDDSVNLLQLLHLCPPPFYFIQGWRGLHSRYWRFHWYWGFHRCNMHFHPSFHLLGLPLISLPGCNLCSCHTEKENQPIRCQSSFTRVMWHLFELVNTFFFSRIPTWFSADYFVVLFVKKCLKNGANM